MSFLSLILRNLTRNRRRGVLMASGIGVAAFVIASLLSVEAGFGALIGSADDTLLNVREKALACPVTGRVFDSDLATIAGMAAVRDATGVLRGLYSYQDKKNLVVVNGVDLQAFRGVKDVRVLEGSESAFSARPDAALVGRPIASQYGWKVGETVSLLEDRLRFQIAGTFEAADKSYETGVLVHKEYLARLKHDEGKSTFLIVRLKDPAALASVSRAIDAEYANHPKPTKTQSERVARERELQDFRELRRMLGLMVLAAIAVSVFGAANGISMSIRERTREVGILRSLGVRREQILGMLISEAALLALAGGAAGIGLAAVLLATGRTLGGMIPLALRPGALGASLGLALLIGLSGAVLPAVRATRLSIVDALKLAD